MAPDLVYSLLKIGAASLPDQASSSSKAPAISIHDWLELVSNQFFPLDLTTSNEVPMILAQTLVDLSDQDRIRIVEAGDQGPVGLQDVEQPSSMDAEANAIRVFQ